jgi:hypothetical protein
MLMRQGIDTHAVHQKVTHSYQVVGADTEFLGAISPGAWVE